MEITENIHTILLSGESIKFAGVSFYMCDMYLRNHKFNAMERYCHSSI